VIIGTLPRHTVPIRKVNGVADVLPSHFEYAYYFCVFYGTIGSALQLAIPMFGAGMMVLLAAFCLVHLGSQKRLVFRQISLPLGCAITFLVIQLVVYRQSLIDPEGRQFVTWILGLIIVQAVSPRHGFLRRFAWVQFIIGLTVLPFLSLSSSGEVDRIGDSEGRLAGLSGPNGLGEWFGFCAVYFVIAGMEAKRNQVRLINWLASVVCLYMLGLSVSRGALSATMIAIALGLCRSLKVALLPVFCLLILSWGVYEAGVFDHIVDMYVYRGTEETGRLVLWPLVIERILGSPLAGVGVSNIETYVQEAGKAYSPHNGFLYIALASGIVPFAFFVAYWCRTARGSLRSSNDGTPDAPFRIPLLVFVFLTSFAGNGTFMSSWAIVALANAIPPNPNTSLRLRGRRGRSYSASSGALRRKRACQPGYG
jgi:O-Antigen ligase